jgi:glycosyltransferase involved in cell wall biosynthesis
VVKRIAFAVPGDLSTPTGGYGYDRRVIAELRTLGWQVDVLSLGDGFPRPSPEQRAFALSQLQTIPEDVPVVVDGLALGALPPEAEQIAKRTSLVALVHHPLALETGLSPADVDKFFESERAALAAAHTVIVTSPYTSERLIEDYDVPPESITVAPPGTDRGAPSKGSTDGVVRLLSVGAVVPRKGFDILIAALAPIADLPWRLTIAGDLTRDPATAEKLQVDILQQKLVDRIELLGAVSQERVFELYSSADIFVLASHFEGYGMAYAEAMAHGLPVIGTTGGATMDTVPATAGVLVDPGNVKALTRALQMLIKNENERRWFASGALEASAQLPTWKDTAEIIAETLEDIA